MKKYLLIILTLLLNPFYGYSQTGKLFEADKQLSSSFVNQIYLDRDGFIWVATRNGLCRYDGYQFRIFKKETDESMLSNYVNSILQDRKGLFYIGLFGALQTFDGNVFREVKVKILDGHIVPCYITTFAELPSGTVMVGTSGHGVVQMDSPTTAHQLGGGLANVVNIQQLMCDHRRQHLRRHPQERHLPAFGQHLHSHSGDRREVGERTILQPRQQNHDRLRRTRHLYL